jgi:beta-glucosidase
MDMRQLFVSLFIIQLSFTAFSQSADDLFWNQKLPLNTRVQDLIKRLSIDEKISLLHETSPGIDRLGIPKYYMGNEALHGVIRPGKFTVFPQSIGLAATWNTDLLYKITTAISDEARGRWNELQQGKNQHELYSDLLVFWSPDINLARDPRWGRTQETYGEDPYLSSRLAVAFIQGLQGNNPDYLKVVATPKHFTANNEEHNRFECNAIFSEKSLREYYLVPFEYAIKEGKAESIMTAYNAINGMPCTISKKLLTDILRDEWGFKGFTVSDCGAPGMIVSKHKYFQTLDSSAAACVNAGLDLECSGGCGMNCNVYKNFLKPALQKGFITEAQIDTSAARVLRARFKMGVFDKDQSANPYAKILPSVVGCEAHKQLALEAARQSIVLLKNTNSLLPLNPAKLKSIAVFGPNSSNCVFGGYSAKESANEPVSVLQGLKNKANGSFQVNVVPWNDMPDKEYSLISSEFFQTKPNDKNGLTAEYFDNKNLTGSPKVRIDDCINFNPVQQAPDPFIPRGAKSIRWTGIFKPEQTGIYSIAINHVDGIRLFIDDKLVIDNWHDRVRSKDLTQLNLTAEKDYKIVFEYYDTGDEALVQLSWKPPVTRETDFYKKEREIAAQSDYVVVVLGLNTYIENEGTDKKDLELPEDQHIFIQEIYKANPNTIVVLESGSPLAINWINDNIPAVINAWYAGEQGGNAIADVLLGNYNPAGRLPLTFYKSTKDLLPFDDYEITKGRTYMYSHVEPLYPFGYGLSYTQFDYSDLDISKPLIDKGETLEVELNVKNSGNSDGDEVIQLYVRNKTSSQLQPVKALKGFKRIGLHKGESNRIRFVLSPGDFRYFDEEKKSFVVESGTYELLIGASSEDIRLKREFRIN